MRARTAREGSLFQKLVAAARGQKSDHMNDVYSFGCLILFMLTGQTPPESKDGSAARGALQKLADRRGSVASRSESSWCGRAVAILRLSLQSFPSQGRRGGLELRHS